MMLTKQNFVQRHSELFLDKTFDPDLISQPGDHRFAKHFAGPWKCLEAGYKQAFKLDERLLKKYNVIKFFAFDSGLSQAEVDRVLRKFIVMLLARKAFFFCCGDEFTVTEKRGRSIVKIAGDAEDVSHKDGCAIRDARCRM